MDNNDILIRLRYALDIKNTDMVKIFKLGGIELSKEEVEKRLIKSKEISFDEIETTEDLANIEDNIKCSHGELENFLNGFIIDCTAKAESLKHIAVS